MLHNYPKKTRLISISKQSVILALLDLSAAFDTIDHHILLERLRITIGLSGTVLSWFESYVTGRSQSVIVNFLQSSIFDVQFGMAQFCILCTQHHLARSLKNTTLTIICMLMTLSCINLSLFQIFNF